MKTGRLKVFRFAFGTCSLFLLLGGCLAMFANRAPKLDWDSVGGMHPRDGAKIFGTKPTVRWTASANATGYWIQFADAEAKIGGAAAKRVSKPEYTLQGIPADARRIFWRVRKLNRIGWPGSWSPIRELALTPEADQSIAALRPVDGSLVADTRPALSWQRLDGATFYELGMAGTQAGAENANAVRTTAPAYRPDAELPNYAAVHWRVRAVDAGGQAGAWSRIRTFRVVDDGFVFVKGGTFAMGTPTEGEADERPVHNVRLNDFRMSPHEVTQEEYEAVIGTNPADNKGVGKEKYPVEQVSWYDAVAYCNALSRGRGLEEVYTITGEGGRNVEADFGKNGYRLPTEAEWEFAARGGTNSRNYTYSGSSNLADAGWYRGNSGHKTHPAGGKKPNELGLFDMSGNVWEWCWDRYGPYESNARSNPVGPAGGRERVMRGGAMADLEANNRPTVRDKREPDGGGTAVGFRIVRNAEILP